MLKISCVYKVVFCRSTIFLLLKIIFWWIRFVFEIANALKLELLVFMPDLNIDAHNNFNDSDYCTIIKYSQR